MPGSRRTRGVVAAVAPVLSALVVLGAPPPAQAVVTPGTNAAIYYAAAGVDADGDFEIMTVTPGSAPTAITKNTYYDAAPDVSPDGSEILFESDRAGDGGSDLYVMDTLGRHVQRLTDVGTAFEASWSPDGTKIAYVDSSFYPYRIMVMDADGSHPHTLVSDTTSLYTPRWSPDGTRIAYSGSLPGSPTQVFVVDVDGGNRVQVTTGSSFEYAPSWSPDGSRLVFISTRDGGTGGEIYTIKPDGTSPVRLTYDSFYDNVPAYSPDGTRIVFDSAGRADPYDDVFVMNADGSNIQNLTSHPGSNDRDATWARQPSSCQGRAVTISGTAGGDVLMGTPGPDVIQGGPGNDVIDGGGGADVICGGAGTDTVTYASHQVAVTADLSGSAGDDGSSEDGPAGARDSIGADVESLTGGHGDDVLVGSSVGNVLSGGPGDDVLRGQEGNDQLTGGTGEDALSGGDGSDSLAGSSSDDVLVGGEGNDSLDGGLDGDSLKGGPGVDTVTYAGRSAVVIVTIGAGTGDDGGKLDGPVGQRDTVLASVENLVGGSSADSLTGNDLDNTLTGGLGADTLKGLAGSDTLYANDGVADALIDGGADSDTCYFDPSLDPAPVSCP